MTSEYTPGPWHIGAPPPHMPDTSVFDERGLLIATTGGMSSNLPEHAEAMSQHEANARLIAAAPTLLAALQELLRATNTIEVLGEWVAEDRNHRLEKEERAKVNAILAQARSAIAKALGQEAVSQ